MADRAAGRWGNRLAALVVNTAPLPHRRRGRIRRGVSGGRGLAVVPESRVMLASTVTQVADQLDGVWTLKPVNAARQWTRSVSDHISRCQPALPSFFYSDLP